jgi:hypothetical protein
MESALPRVQHAHLERDTGILGRLKECLTCETASGISSPAGLWRMPELSISRGRQVLDETRPKPTQT